MSISRTYNHKYQARFSYCDSATGKRYFKSKTFSLKSDTEAWLLKQKVDHSQGKSRRYTKLMWLYDHYYEIYKEPTLSSNTQRIWKEARKDLSPYFKDIMIQDLSSDDVQKALTDYAKFHTVGTVANRFARLHEVLKYAVQEGYIIHDPMVSVHFTGKDSVKVTYLTVAQIKQVLDYIDSHTFERRIGHTVETGTDYAIASAILTGARESELAGLTWDRVDFEHKTITIDRQILATSKSNDFAKLKTPSSVRTISVPDRFLEMIKPLRAPGDTLVFNSRLNSHLSVSSLSYVLRHLLKKLGIDAPGFHFHSLRHSHVALLLSEGVDIYAISKRLGHASFQTTLSTYAYLIDEKEKKEDDKIRKVLDSL